MEIRWISVKSREYIESVGFMEINWVTGIHGNAFVFGSRVNREHKILK